MALEASAINVFVFELHILACRHMNRVVKAVQQSDTF